MSTNPSSDINQPIKDSTRARANTVASVTASSTVGSIVSPIPSTPNLERGSNAVDDTPAGQDDIATPPTQPFSRLSISARRTLDLGNRVGDTNEPKVPHQLAASAQIESGGTVSSPPSVVTHGSLGADDHTEAVKRSPDSDPFEYDDNVSTQSSVEHHESVNSSNQVDDCNDTNVAQQLLTSDESYSDGILSTNPTTNEPVEDDDPNAVQHPFTSDQSEPTGTLPSNAATVVPGEHHDPNAVQQPSTLDQFDSTGSILAYPATVDPTPTLTPPAHFPLEQFQPLVHALAQLSYPFTFDGDIVMPDDQHLELQIWQKGYQPSFGPRPAAPRNKWAKAAKVGPFDMSKE